MFKAFRRKEMKQIEDIKGMKDMIKAIPVEWEIHLSADVEIEGMKLTVTFDRPVGN
jgi:hypothetical protein